MIEVTGRRSAPITRRGPATVAGRTTTVAGRATAGSTTGAALALHARRARGSGTCGACPDGDARSTECAADGRRCD